MQTRIDGRTLRYQHRRGELLDAVGEYVLDNGIAALSLRRVADAVGVSHVTLQHHFGSKEELVGEIVEHLLARTLIPQPLYADGVPNPQTDATSRLRTLWAHLTSQPGQRDLCLFIEVLGQSRFQGADYSPVVERAIHHHLDLLSAGVVGRGCPQGAARAHATVFLATLRGLVIDLLATGDRERVDEAFEMVVANAELHAAEWSASLST
ncbi:MAG TPA: TetR/AcrR family transcriptional regulator [Solirubrobacteraceae bacterium]|jgi:AcrR family transcriptional regulator|nr:TetR/AcrR family transcriptional regulator [Solirubrobacteraceae bacterium]